MFDQCICFNVEGISHWIEQKSSTVIEQGIIAVPCRRIQSGNIIEVPVIIQDECIVLK